MEGEKQENSIGSQAFSRFKTKLPGQPGIEAFTLFKILATKRLSILNIRRVLDICLHLPDFNLEGLVR